jgi:hypothetical protein
MGRRNILSESWSVTISSERTATAAPLLRPTDRQAVTGHHARRAHQQLLGRPADRRGLTKHRRQVRLRATEPARRPGRYPSQRLGRRRRTHRGFRTAAAGHQGLCHRPRSVGRRPPRVRRQRRAQDHPGHPGGDRGDAAGGLPFDAAALWALGTTVTTIVPAVPAHADVDTDLANQLHAYGIYGQRDYDAWLAKINCERLDDGP